MSSKSVDLNDYSYFPALRTRAAELNALRHLTDERKNQIVPLLTLGKWPKAQGFESAAKKIIEVFPDRPYFLDLTKEKNTFPDQLGTLKDPTNGYLNWQNFVDQYENAFPVIQKSQGSLRNFIKQARECESKFQKIAFRISDFTSEVGDVISALSSLESIENAVIFIDSKYIRNSYAAFVAANVAMINTIRDEIPDANISTLATSFPSSLATYAKENGKSGALEILERQLHTDIGGHDVAAYGDYGSIHGIIYDDAPEIMRWAARVDYPKELEWQFERRPKGTAKSDFHDAAKKILETNPEIGSREIWGEEIIKLAAADPNFTCIAGTPASWISVRVNIHISKQIDFTSKLLNPDEDEWDEAEDLDF